jgi:hypothetical protein
VAIARDNKADEAAFRQDLLNIAKTTLSSKILTQGEANKIALLLGLGQ